MKYMRTRLILSIVTAMMCSTSSAQLSRDIIRKELKADVNRAAGTFYALPVTKQKDTPVPGNKKPFYVNHYACPSGYYLPRQKDYEEPYAIFVCADSLGKLTKLGRDVKNLLDQLRKEARGRTEELTVKGARQSRGIMHQLVERIPDAFVPEGYYTSHSVVHNHCILTMQEAMLELATMKRPLSLSIRSSHQEDRFMEPEDKLLTDHRVDSLTLEYYERFSDYYTNDTRLMGSLFNDANYIASHIDAEKLSLQLFKLAGNSQHTELTGKFRLFDIFTADEIYGHWRMQNAWNYINFGGYKLNGGTQPYLQRTTLRNMIHMGDSMMNRNSPLMHNRYTHESVILALASLMELDNCGVQTENLDSLEALGWVDYRIAPLGGSIVMIHYRSEQGDPDVLVKVLHNGREARLPIASDCAPYYHWQDVKRYYLRKLYRYENKRFNEKVIW